MSQNQKTAELIDKMCRKISQLTRVVYILNSKNDENESITEAIISRFENDIQQQSKETNSVIKKMKSQIDKIKSQSNPDEKINEIKDKYDRRKSFYKYIIFQHTSYVFAAS